MQKRASSLADKIEQNPEPLSFRSIQEAEEELFKRHEEILNLFKADHEPSATKKLEASMINVELALLQLRKDLRNTKDASLLSDCNDLMNWAAQLTARLKNDKTELDVTKAFVIFFVAPLASYNLLKIYFPSNSHVPDVAPAIVAGTGVLFHFQKELKRAWKRTGDFVTSRVKASGSYTRKTAHSLKLYSQKKKTVVKDEFNKCRILVSRKVKQVPNGVRKLVRKIRGNELS